MCWIVGGLGLRWGGRSGRRSSRFRTGGGVFVCLAGFQRRCWGLLRFLGGSMVAEVLEISEDNYY